MQLLLAGGGLDPNLVALKRCAQKMGVPVLDLCLPPGASSSFSWDMDSCRVAISGEDANPDGAFIRFDVFEGMADPRPEISARASAWFQTISAWLLTESRVRMFNREIAQSANFKPSVLKLAKQAGLVTPQTVITNDAGQLNSKAGPPRIAKPVGGGDFCYELDDALSKSTLHDGIAAMPAIVQQRLIAPEIRIYIIGSYTFAFEVRSSSLDYRVSQDAELILLDEPPPEAAPLRRLMSVLKMDFSAADFKTDPINERLLFLELNTSPMFARFDEVAGGRVCEAIVRELAPL